MKRQRPRRIGGAFLVTARINLRERRGWAWGLYRNKSMGLLITVRIGLIAGISYPAIAADREFPIERGRRLRL